MAATGRRCSRARRAFVIAAAIFGYLATFAPSSALATTETIVPNGERSYNMGAWSSSLACIVATMSWACINESPTAPDDGDQLTGSAAGTASWHLTSGTLGSVFRETLWIRAKSATGVTPTFNLRKADGTIVASLSPTLTASWANYSVTVTVPLTAVEVNALYIEGVAVAGGSFNLSTTSVDLESIASWTATGGTLDGGDFGIRTAIAGNTSSNQPFMALRTLTGGCGAGNEHSHGYARRWDWASSWQVYGSEIAFLTYDAPLCFPYNLWRVTDVAATASGSTNWVITCGKRWNPSVASNWHMLASYWSGSDFVDEIVIPYQAGMPGNLDYQDECTTDASGSDIVAASTRLDNNFTVRRRTGVNTWTQLGGNLNLSGSTQAYGAVALVNGEPWVVMRNNVAGTYQLRVQRWNGSAWVEPQAGVLSAGGTVTSVAIANDASNMPYIAYVEANKVYVKQWNGSSFVSVGGASPAPATNATFVDVQVHPTSNKPYVTYSGSGTTGQFVQSWSGSAWSAQTVAGAGTTATRGHIAISAGLPWIAYTSNNDDAEAFAYVVSTEPFTPNATAVASPTNDNTPALSSTAFSDRDVLDTHGRSQWQVRTSAGTYASPAWDSGASTSLTSISSGALADGDYCYQVRHADQALTWSDYSSEQCFNVDTTAPTPVSATGSATSTTSITWTQSTATDAQGHLSATPYSVDSGTPAWQASTSFVETGLSANTQYTRTVRTRDTLGNTATASVSRYTWPNAPTGLAATVPNWSVGNGYAVQLNWSAPAGGASSYNIRSSADAYATVVATSAVPTRLVTGLAANTAYTYKVCAVNADGVQESTCSSTASATTPPAAPSAPNSNSITTTSANFTWTAATGATKYELTISPNATCAAGADVVIDPATSPQAHGSLLTDRTYTFRIRSYSTTSGAYGAPTSCTTLSSTTQRTAIGVSVDAPSVNLGSAAPGATLTGSTTITTTTYGATGYTIDASVDQLLTSGGNTVPATTSGSIAVPGTWSGTGFGITVSSAVNLAAKWSSGTKYAALTTSPTQIHATGAAFTTNTANATDTVIGYRLVAPPAQPVGTYTCTATYVVIPSS